MIFPLGVVIWSRLAEPVDLDLVRLRPHLVSRERQGEGAVSFRKLRRSMPRL